LYVLSLFAVGERGLCSRYAWDCFCWSAREVEEVDRLGLPLPPEEKTAERRVERDGEERD
jgi:hypothetical protein